MRESDDDPRAMLWDAVSSLHATLTAGIALDEALARECARLAHAAEMDGNPAFVEALRSLSRTHRVGALELNGLIAALEARYENLLKGERHQGRP